jgi:hypothetical protein
VVRSIAALPTQIMQVQYDQISQSNALVTAENNILASQNKTLGLLTNPSTAPSPGAPSGSPTFPGGPSYTVPGTPSGQGTLTGLGRTASSNTYASCSAINSNSAAQAKQ